MTPEPVWTRSTRCTGGNCVEIAATDTAVLVRDSKNPRQQYLEFSPAAFGDFAAAFQAGEFDHL